MYGPYELFTLFLFSIIIRWRNVGFTNSCAAAYEIAVSTLCLLWFVALWSALMIFERRAAMINDYE